MSRRSRWRSVSPWGRHGRTGHRTAGANGAAASVGYDRCQPLHEIGDHGRADRQQGDAGDALFGAIGPDDSGADGDEHGQHEGSAGQAHPATDCRSLRASSRALTAAARWSSVMAWSEKRASANSAVRSRSGCDRTPSVDRARVDVLEGRLGVPSPRGGVVQAVEQAALGRDDPGPRVVGLAEVGQGALDGAVARRSRRARPARRCGPSG